MIKKNFLIFSGVGDNENQFFSWAKNKSDVYDRAFFYYGTEESRKEELVKMNIEYFFDLKGEIWANFSSLYEKNFSEYEYVLIVDSDLIVEQKNIEDTFFLFQKNQYSAGTWSRSGNDCGAYVKFFSKYKNRKKISESNFIEMLFMIIKKDLIEKTIEKWKELELEYCGGLDIILSNVAYNNKMLPFRVINFYEIYNPFPEEKKYGREIDRILGNKSEERLHNLNKVLDSSDYFKLKSVFNIDGHSFDRYVQDFVLE